MSDTQVLKKYLLGVDVGNTKTDVLIIDLSGNVIHLSKAGCANHEVMGIDGFTEVLYTAVDDACETAKINRTDIIGMGFGIAGYDWPSQKPIMEKAIHSLGVDCPYLYVNDAVIGLIAGSSGGWGVSVDAGTGNNVWGRDKSGRMGRITGNGILFGEIGGAGEIVWRAMVAVTYAWTKRGPLTKLTQMMVDFARVPDESALIEALATEQFQLPPKLAIEIFKLAEKGDLVALDVVRFCATELAENTNAVIRQLNLQDSVFKIVLIGSVFKVGEIYNEPFRETIKRFAPGAQLVHLHVPPVVGSVMLAAEATGLDSSELREPLLQSIHNFIAK